MDASMRRAAGHASLMWLVQLVLTYEGGVQKPGLRKPCLAKAIDQVFTILGAEFAKLAQG
jgi:hypothetical protein